MLNSKKLMTGSGEFIGRWTRVWLLSSAVFMTSIFTFTTDGWSTDPDCGAFIGDYVWEDVNIIGLQDEAAATYGINGITVLLNGVEKDDDIVSQTFITTTGGPDNSPGYYEFWALCPGTYTVTVDTSTLPNGLIASPCSTDPSSTGTGNDTDSNCSPQTSIIFDGTNPTERNETIDFGYYYPPVCDGSIGNFVWYDLDGNSLQGTDEQGISGVTVTLTHSDGTTDITTTDSSGGYQFTGLCAGDYTVVVDQTSPPLLPFVSTTRCSNSQDTDGDSNANGAVSNHVNCIPVQDVTLTGDHHNNPTIDFGFIMPGCNGTIGDYVWNDADGNGFQDGGENGIPGVTVTLTDNFLGTEVETSTDEFGVYLFAGLCPGDYTVEVDKYTQTLPSGFVPTTTCSNNQNIDDDSNANGAGDNSADCTPIQDVKLPIPNTDNTDNPTIDFGFVTGCTGTIGDYVWYDTIANGFQDNDEDGIPGVTVRLTDDSDNLIAASITDANGTYLFSGLCSGYYTVEVDINTLPLGYVQTTQCSSHQDTPDDSNADDTVSCTPKQTLYLGNTENLTIDFGFITPNCNLEVVKSCFVPVTETPASLYNCDKSIDVLTMIWNGSDVDYGDDHTISIIAWKDDGTQLAKIDDIMRGSEVTVSGYAGSQNDVYWEIFDDEGHSLGESNFHLSCSDPEMNGPEDCSIVAEGNGKNNETYFINDWLLEGIVDAKNTLDCTVEPISEVRTSECEFYTQEDTLCEKRPTAIMLSYLGGDCSQSDHSQDPAKFSCVDYDVDSQFEPVRIVMSEEGGSNVNLDTGYPANVSFGDVLEAVTAYGRSDFDSSSVVQIFANDGPLDGALEGTTLLQEVVFHTSCSQPLAPGDVFGGVQVVGFENADQGLVLMGTEVKYTYVIKNIGNDTVTDLVVFDDKLGDVEIDPAPDSDSLAPGFIKTLNVTALVADTTTNIVTVTGTNNSGDYCGARDSATVTALGPPPCAVSSVEFKILDDKVEWKLSNDGDKVITIESIQIRWPAGLGQLKKVKREGDTIYEKFVDLPFENPHVIFEDMLTTDLKKRQINPGDSNKVIFEFTARALTYPEDYTITIKFREGCSVQVVQSEAPTCEVNPVEFKISDDKVEWFLSNDGDRLVTINSIDFTWPADPTDPTDLTARQLKKVKREGDTIFETLVSPTNVLIGSEDWINDLNKRQIKAGDTNKIVFEFSSKATTIPDDYKITVKFDEGCSVTFKPEEAGSIPFVCKDVQPIDSLTMIWDGEKDIESIAVYRDTYDPSHPENNLIKLYTGTEYQPLISVADTGFDPAQAQEFTATGYATAAAKNDVDWFITYSDGSTGISRFHRSCSDDNMDGPEDCGKVQGNSKDDTSGLVNEWLFEGMTGNGLTLDCTP